MTKLKYLVILVCLVIVFGCTNGEKPQMTNEKETNSQDAPAVKEKKQDDFKYFVEQFADIKLGRFQIPGFDSLTPKQKEMLYYLYQAGLSGRDIIWDQKYKNNLKIRRTLETIVKNYKGDRNSEDFKKFMLYTKRVWFSNGIHHHYSTDKFLPEFTPDYFAQLVNNCPDGKFPMADGEKLEDFITAITPILFDPKVDPKGVSTDTSKDIVANSAANFYENVTQAEVEAYYKKFKTEDDPAPISYGLNSKMVKEDGKIKELPWKVGGMYGPAIEKIVYWLEKAASVAENEHQAKVLNLLIAYYKSGDLKMFDKYNIAWIADTASRIDAVNGFIETYGDCLGLRGSFESVVSFRDEEASKRVNTITANAGWFEQNSSTAPEHKKKEIKGVSAKVITVVGISGDAAPNPPLGINLPNATWIRKTHGSKSVTIGNISSAYMKIGESTGVTEEFCYSDEEAAMAKKYGEVVGNLHTDMHEIIGHGSGQINPGVDSPRKTLKNYSAAIEETRADLVAYYFMMDPKLVELGLLPDNEAGKVALSRAVRNGMMVQLTRIKLGDNVEQAHMRNRQLIAKWAFELGKADNVIEKKIKDGKTYFVVNDYDKLRTILGKMLREIQRITSEGDFKAAEKLIETYAVKIDPDLHKEVLERYKKLGVAPYTGFICPVLKPVEKDGKIVDVKVEYPTDFVKQMIFYGDNYSFLPTNN